MRFDEPFLEGRQIEPGKVRFGLERAPNVVDERLVVAPASGRRRPRHRLNRGRELRQIHVVLLGAVRLRLRQPVSEEGVAEVSGVGVQRPGQGIGQLCCQLLQA